MCLAIDITHDLSAYQSQAMQWTLPCVTHRVSRDCDVVTFYQTFVKYTLLVQERREVFRKAKVCMGRGFIAPRSVVITCSISP